MAKKTKEKKNSEETRNLFSIYWKLGKRKHVSENEVKDLLRKSKKKNLWLTTLIVERWPEYFSKEEIDDIHISCIEEGIVKNPLDICGSLTDRPRKYKKYITEKRIRKLWEALREGGKMGCAKGIVGRWPKYFSEEEIDSTYISYIEEGIADCPGCIYLSFEFWSKKYKTRERVKRLWEALKKHGEEEDAKELQKKYQLR